MLPLASHVVLLQDGCVVAQGDAAEMRTQPWIRSVLATEQAGEDEDSPANRESTTQI